MSLLSSFVNGTQGFTVDGWLNDIDEEESFVDKCIWVEGQDKPTMVAYRGSEVETSLIGTVIEDMRIQNCGYVESTHGHCCVRCLWS